MFYTIKGMSSLASNSKLYENRLKLQKLCARFFFHFINKKYVIMTGVAFFFRFPLRPLTGKVK